MSLIPKVGRRSPQVRVKIGLIYLILILGALTMIYPFLLMISGSFKSSVDINNHDIIPRYFFDDEMLYRKFIESKYNESIRQYNVAADRDYYSFQEIQSPLETDSVSVSDWRLFLQQADLPMTYFQLGHTLSAGNKLLPEMIRKFRNRVQRIANNSIEEFNRIFQENTASWFSIVLRQEKLMERRYQLSQKPLIEEFYRFKKEQAPWYLFPLNLDRYYIKEYLQFLYSKDIEQYNNKHNTEYANYSEVQLK